MLCSGSELERRVEVSAITAGLVDLLLRVFAAQRVGRVVVSVIIRFFIPFPHRQALGNQHVETDRPASPLSVGQGSQRSTDGQAEGGVKVS